MTRFARVYRTFFFEEPMFHDDDGDPWLETYEPLPGLTVCVPHLCKNADPAQDLAATRKLLRDLISAREIKLAILWFYTPMALKYARDVQARLVVYDCMDELSAFMHAPGELVELEAELLKRADLVFPEACALRSPAWRHPTILRFRAASMPPLRPRAPRDQDP